MLQILFFTIENNFEKQISENEKGIGLDNLEKRLKHMYPNQYELIIEEFPSIYRASINIKLI